MNDLVLQAVGWGGSALLVISLLQSRMLALRILNLAAALLLVGYNTVLLVWPSVAMNAAVAGIDVFYLAVWAARRGRARRVRSSRELPDGP